MTIQQIRSSKKSGHYVTYIFSDFGSTVTLINDQKYNHTTFQHFLPVKVLMIFNVIPTFCFILEETILTLQQLHHLISQI